MHLSTDFLGGESAPSIGITISFGSTENNISVVVGLFRSGEMNSASLRKYLFRVIVSLLMIAAFKVPAFAAQSTSACQEAVAAFVAKATEARHAALERIDPDGCWATIDASEATFDALNRRVAAGNRWAAEYTATHLAQSDGGNLEDMLVALGQFAEHDIERLLLFEQQGVLSKRHVADALTMLPLELGDDYDAQLKVLGERRRKVMRVTRPDLPEQKREALSAIDDFAAEIRSKTQ